MPQTLPTFRVERARVGRRKGESTVFRAIDNQRLYRIRNFGKLAWAPVAPLVEGARAGIIEALGGMMADPHSPDCA